MHFGQLTICGHRAGCGNSEANILDASVGVLPVDALLRASPFSSSNGFVGCNTCRPPLRIGDFNKFLHEISAG